MKFVFPAASTVLRGSRPWIIAAPMNGGINNPRFAAAVINSGGVGSFGFTYHTTEAIEREIEQTRALTTGGPINANFFVFDEFVEPSKQQVAVATLSLQHAGVQAISTELFPPHTLELTKQLEAVWRTRPEILTFHFGIPSAEVLTEARKLNISVGITATTVDEALEIQKCGADFVVAQGSEAGGHLGMFNHAWKKISEANEPLGLPLTTMQLVESLHRHPTFHLPIVAAGGIMTGQDIHRALCAGASAVQMGTAFLPCVESTASAAHKRYLLTEPLRPTQITTAFSGRPARGIKNAFMERMEGQPRLPFPVQNKLTSAMRAQAVRDDNGEMQSLWAGTEYGVARQRLHPQAAQGRNVDYLTVQELMDQLFEEYRAVST